MPTNTVDTANRRHLPVRPEWLALHEEDILDPDLPIIDPHHHLWNRDGMPYLLPEFLSDTNSGHRIEASVFIECHAMYRHDAPAHLAPIGEVEFANGIAAMSASGDYGQTRVATGIVGNADLGRGEQVREVLEAQLASAGGRFKGVRNISAYHSDPAARGSTTSPPPDVLTRPEFTQGLRVLTDLGLSFDAWMYHTQLGELVGIARAMPDAAIVLNHVGGAIGIGPYEGKRDEVFTAWRRSVIELAGCPNVCIKLGGLGMRLFGFDLHERAEPPSSEQVADAWRPYVETCIEAFGPERAMFESNFPVDKGTCSYQVVWNAFKRIAAGASAQEKRDLFFGTAQRFYRLD